MLIMEGFSGILPEAKLMWNLEWGLGEVGAEGSKPMHNFLQGGNLGTTKGSSVLLTVAEEE